MITASHSLHAQNLNRIIITYMYDKYLIGGCCDETKTSSDNLACKARDVEH